MSKMSISSISSTRQAKRPARVVVYGVSGVGKTTFAAGAPKPVFLCAEDGAGFLDAQAFERPTSWSDVHEAIRSLTNDEHPFETFVIDTLDALEPLCAEHVCKVNGNKKNLEDFGYGKGWVLAQEEWRKFLAALEQLQVKRGMHVVLLAHAVTREHKDPELDAAFKRWVLKLHNKLAEATAEWTDALLFTTHEAVTRKEGLRVRGIATGERQLLTTWAGSHDGKNRYDLPPIITLSWDAFWQAALPALRPAVAPAGPTPAELEECGRLCSALDTLLPQLEGDPLVKARTAYRDMPRDQVGKLRGLHKRVVEVLEQQSAERRAREEQLRADAAAARAAREAALTTSDQADVSAA